MSYYKEIGENAKATAVRFDSWEGIGWPVYEKYEMEEGEDDVFLVARRSPPREKPKKDRVGGAADFFRDRRLKVYSPPLDTPDLFVRFATLGRKPRITFEDMQEWVTEYGALGLAEVDVVEVTNDKGIVVRTDAGEARREGFRPFCEAAWEMAETLSLFEALTDPQLQARSLTKILEKHSLGTGVPQTSQAAWTRVEQRVLSHVRRYCYPMSYRHTHAETGEVSHTPGWGFDSLPGAMYLEFKHAMESRSQIRRCAAPDCGRIISVGGVELQTNVADYGGPERGSPRKPRIDRKYCPDTNDNCKQKAYDRKQAAKKRDAGGDG